ncbi:hypothetical protein AAH021_10970 [Bacteroides thetaiotaomicron]|uniref:hypothetical protein n=1 Tax=Bacteroides thetaiotaomicron TaxID=818 RepID=UPI0039B678FD
MELIVGFFCILFALGISIATAVLASRKGRNSVNWFFLSLFWGIVGLIVLACSKHLEREKRESDTLVKVLWSIVLIPLVLFAYIFYDISADKRKYQDNQIEEVAPKIELSDNYIERTVDLNDYFNSSTGWDDDTDWNYAGLEDEECQKAFDKVLEKNGIYWSDQKQCWVKKVKKTAEQAPKVKFR